MDYMELARTVAKASKCVRKKVGSVIVLGDNVVGTGYNGTPRGTCNNCEDSTGNTHPHTIHSELNAVLNALTSDLEGGVMYCTLSPCLHCAAVLIQKKFKAVYFEEEYKDSEGVNYLNSNGVVCVKYDICW